MNVSINPYRYMIAADSVPEKFVEEVAEGIKTIGRSGMSLMKDEGLKYILAKKTSDVFPELKGVTPRGWPSNMTWDDAPAVSPTHLRVIGLFSKPKYTDIPNVVRHEMGHRIDSSFYYKIGEFFTNTKGYQEVYSNDLEGIGKKLDMYELSCDDLSYMLQGSTPKKLSGGGKSESFAEIYAMLRGGSMANNNIIGIDEIMPDIFPKTVAYVRKLLWFMGDK